MPEENKVMVTLKGGGLNFDYQTSLQKAAHIIAFLTSNEVTASVSTSGTALEIAPARGAGAVSPIESVRQSGACTYPQKIATLGHFITGRDRRDTFDPKEVNTLLRRMGDMPKNFTRDLQNAELLGYITREPNGEYLITDHGIQSVLSQFNEAVGANAGRKKKSRALKSAEDQELVA